MVLLVDVLRVMLTCNVTYCSAFGTRFDSIMAALWDQRMVCVIRI